uniref:Cholesterol transporter ABCA5 n=1 Tax=Strigops habroptila TaxID=2489341 RepID=A0A672UQS1_STRHB
MPLAVRASLIFLGNRNCKIIMVEIDNFPRAIILIYLVIAFSPFGYYLAIHIVAEKERKLKEFLKILGLHDTAFWLSWVLLYISLIFVMSILMAVIATASSLFPQSSAFVIFLLFFLYGVSSVSIPDLTEFSHPIPMELFPFPSDLVLPIKASGTNTASVGAIGSGCLTHPHPIPRVFSSLGCCTGLNKSAVTVKKLAFSLCYPGEFGLRRTPFFFMKPSFWSKHRKNYKELYESSVNGSLSFSEIVEPVPLEFQGKEAIRISCVQKTFRKKGETVEALRNLSFDIYEGQITALLGHSGTGKTTLMNILCGLCPPTDGFVSVYGHKVSEIDEMLEVRQIAGVCPQSDIHFDILTVEENLSIFAAIKGIPQNDLIQEVQKVLLDLDMQPIRDNQAKKLSGGQKRRLSVGVAVLGNPKVLLLDEPTAGMDPCSRHIVWNLLKNRKADRVTVFSTHFMDEADILADRKAVISQGMLKCLGSSLFLKSKWGIGYRLSMHIDAYCNTEATTSLIRQHIPAASLLQENDEQLVYTLPLKDMDKFAGLFSDLDTHSHLGVITYGVSMTTLEDVYLKLEVEAEIDQADYSVFNSQQVQDEMDTKSLDDMEQSLLMLSETKAPAMSNTALWKKQVSTIAKVHFLSLKRENKCVRIKAYTQLKIAGLYPSAYWTGQAVVDLPLFFSILILMIGSLFAFHYGVYFYKPFLSLQIFCLIGYVPSVVLFTYVVSFTFKKVQNTKEFWSFIFSVVSSFTLVLPQLFYCPYLQCVVWLFLLRCFELKNGGRTVREDPFFRSVSFPDVPRDENEDEDVKAERLRVQEVLSSPKSEEMPAILVSSLHKEFDERKEFLLGRKIKKVATNHVSLCVKKGEILGLLGPNGAGKSTLINMLVGEIEPTSGQVLKFVGYCPQTNPLWPDITLQEHFEIYGAIKGMSPSDVKEVVKRISSALDLKDHLQKTTKKLGVGLKRKLCFALSMLGNPRVTLLDEPSTGMDPKAKQHMWRAIRAAFKNKERAAILTTHYMEEADAVCDRVAILVSGQLRCIGTVQHLKSKFGRGYFLEMKLKETADVQQVEYLQSQILHIFPNANRQER